MVPDIQDRIEGRPGFPLLPARLRIGTRRSALALTQTRWLASQVQAALAGAGHQVEIELVEVTSHGDVSSAPLSSLGGTGVFVSSLREALLEGRIDVAVHSLKDMPTAPAPGLEIAAIPRREDPRDVLVARGGVTLAQLPAGARIGTGSPRRAAQLRALGAGLHIVDIRGNVDTRVRMVTDGTVDGVILAHAGLLRLGRAADVSDVLSTDVMLPAPGQGALAAEVRAGDMAARAALASVDDLIARSCVTAERALLARLEAGCAAPVGALATADQGHDGGYRLSLSAAVGALDGSVMLRRCASASVQAAIAEAFSTEAHALGLALAGELLAGGAAELIPGGSVHSRTDSATDSLPASSTRRAESSAPAREGEP
jgi:hydroxymethylbilane synthase